MKILLLGKNGQVGWELQRSLAVLGEVIALDRQVASTAYGEISGDLSNLDELRKTIRQVQPQVIVNAAAYTAVDKAETEQVLARTVNALASQVLAEEALQLDALLVHYSTDYVFNGTGSQAWKETDAVSPVNYYGATKLEGEQLIVASGCKHLIFRTSWVYAARGNNFAKTMLRLAKDRPSLNVIADQIGAPTGAELLADIATAALQQALTRPELCGIYHLAPAGEVSWHAYAQFVIDFARANGEPLAVETINPIATTEYPTPAQRPLNSRLNTEKLRHNFSLHLPDWQSGVTRMLMESLNK
ncbi:dTDP-4-dehydrorhamnose reductase [Pseudomonas viridiflava]|uniref:dTDP-4-dehydrorhamnose reductase n=1 Tax=Pseudomonas viridiflava TaxID=33069 RepID=UPI000F067442|nr:dTDP-4-dehydrorhamnose reductase [Pseudomonas viridiflava]MEE3925352.1 dTDP-4-dehydrorhamnose reductase [Pseudomonas viridiflava]MEE3931670.1 dTDP-4-dehydrorhamnose reductase [Pseudomonas viridiflava]MEE3942427.1 dTDP-4-dehydrorhamnose reductase [Pseudomonas viridiflava]MEE3968381.1 dTDP-4-dehydrorhamnose reductase [Pseudomonas viridiflava]MEE3982596.1 dTDP-4-dehydrorhamnose reductase [Pseudomonas viridiflava]